MRERMTERDKPDPNFVLRFKRDPDGEFRPHSVVIPIWPNIEDLDGALRNAKKGVRALIDGRKFQAPERERKDALRKLLERTVKELQEKSGRRPKAREIWDSLAEYDEDQVLSPIQDEEDLLYWGRERKTTYKAFQNRLTQIFKRKIPVSDNPG